MIHGQQLDNRPQTSAGAPLGNLFTIRLIMKTLTLLFSVALALSCHAQTNSIIGTNDIASLTIEPLEPIKPDLEAAELTNQINAIHLNPSATKADLESRKKEVARAVGRCLAAKREKLAARIDAMNHGSSLSAQARQWMISDEIQSYELDTQTLQNLGESKCIDLMRDFAAQAEARSTAANLEVKRLQGSR